MNTFKKIISFIAAIIATELFLSKVIVLFYKFNGFFTGHVLIYYLMFLLSWTFFKLILRIERDTNPFSEEAIAEAIRQIEEHQNEQNDDLDSNKKDH